MIDRTRALAFLDGSEAGLCACVDWLQEQDATLGDVLWLYAYGPPGWLAPTRMEDERVLGLLWRWCKATGPDDFFPQSFGPNNLSIRRHELLRSYHRLLEVGPIDQKRRVLALFPEVERAFQMTVPFSAVANIPARAAAHGIRHLDRPCEISGDEEDEVWVYTQTLAAPDWMPPEKSKYTTLEQIQQRLQSHGVSAQEEFRQRVLGEWPVR